MAEEVEKDEVLYEWHVVDVVGSNAWTWASTREDAIQMAHSIPGIAQVEYCERVKDE
jgi:hypothetical protein